MCAGRFGGIPIRPLRNEMLCRNEDIISLQKTGSRVVDLLLRDRTGC